MVLTEILRYCAFTRDAAGGNPAGVVLDASSLSGAGMQAIAVEVGYSETAFLNARDATTLDVRYFSPKTEVSCCGHATIASAVALAERVGRDDYEFRFVTRAGVIPVRTSVGEAGSSAKLTSVPPTVSDVSDDDVTETLAALGWGREDLDKDLPPRVGFAGARHLILATATRERLANLNYDFDRLATLCAQHDWGTVNLIHRESRHLYHARNPFPLGGVVEDPATGAAAAALGGYLRRLGLVTPPAQISIHQGDDMGRPSLLLVDIPPGDGGVGVTGYAVPMIGA